MKCTGGAAIISLFVVKIFPVEDTLLKENMLALSLPKKIQSHLGVDLISKVYNLFPTSRICPQKEDY